MRGQGIAGHVAETGKILNIHCAYDHPLFYKGLDERTGFITRYDPELVHMLFLPLANS